MGWLPAALEAESGYCVRQEYYLESARGGNADSYREASGVQARGNLTSWAADEGRLTRISKGEKWKSKFNDSA
jgi:hypothetical protein